jgi:hypothetical protein
MWDVHLVLRWSIFPILCPTDAVSCVYEGDKQKTSADLKHNKHDCFVVSSKQDNVFKISKQEPP